jgi:hypothetical protein
MAELKKKIVNLCRTKNGLQNKIIMNKIKYLLLLIVIITSVNQASAYKYVFVGSFQSIYNPGTKTTTIRCVPPYTTTCFVINTSYTNENSNDIQLIAPNLNIQSNQIKVNGIDYNNVSEGEQTIQQEENTIEWQ